MKQPPKLYIFMKNQDYEYKPDERTGYFNLGTVLKQPNDPEALVEGYSIINRHSNMPLRTAWFEDLTTSTETHSEGEYGIFTNFLATLGAPVAADVAYNHKTSEGKVVNTPRFESYFMTPTQAYLEEVANTAAVQAYLRGGRFRNVYIVTGLRVALGGSRLNTTEHEIGGEFKASVDPGAFAGAPGIATVGPDLKHSTGSKSTTGFKNSSDYVYAYRVMEIHYSIRSGELVRKVVKGETYSLEDGKFGVAAGDDKSKHQEVEYDVRIEKDWVSLQDLDTRGLTVSHVEDADGQTLYDTVVST